MRVVEDELSKFERKERAFRQAEQDERIAKLRLPIARNRPFILGRRAVSTAESRHK
jgi:hypothetical protein